MENDPYSTKQAIPQKMIIFKYPENNFLILGHGKRPKIAGKGHGKSWKFIRLR